MTSFTASLKPCADALTVECDSTVEFGRFRCRRRGDPGRRGTAWLAGRPVGCSRRSSVQIQPPQPLTTRGSGRSIRYPFRLPRDFTQEVVDVGENLCSAPSPERARPHQQAPHTPDRTWPGAGSPAGTGGIALSTPTRRARLRSGDDSAGLGRVNNRMPTPGDRRRPAVQPLAQSSTWLGCVVAHEHGDERGAEAAAAGVEVNRRRPPGALSK
jgi:hypothetical protein